MSTRRNYRSERTESAAAFASFKRDWKDERRLQKDRELVSPEDVRESAGFRHHDADSPYDFDIEAFE